MRVAHLTQSLPAIGWAKATELKAMISYVRAKIHWLKGDEQGPEPDFKNYPRLNSRCG
jgi:hypothetical protein